MASVTPLPDGSHPRRQGKRGPHRVTADRRCHPPCVRRDRPAGATPARTPAPPGSLRVPMRRYPGRQWPCNHDLPPGDPMTLGNILPWSGAPRSAGPKEPGGGRRITDPLPCRGPRPDHPLSGSLRGPPVMPVASLTPRENPIM